MSNMQAEITKHLNFLEIRYLQYPHIMSRFVVEIMKIIEATEVKFLDAQYFTLTYTAGGTEHPLRSNR